MKDLQIGYKGIDMKVGLIGDYQESVPAHQAIPTALELAAGQVGTTVEFEWLHSNTLHQTQLQDYSALWCVPASPYENTENVLQAIKYAREENVPFLGTCGGYQHAALEFARHELGYDKADNTEINPQTTMPLISGLACKLYDEEGAIKLTQNSLIAEIYDATSISEEYFCGYGVNRDYLHIFEGTDLYVSGFVEDGDPRCLEIAANKFHLGTAFQPERSALKGSPHPLICAFLNAAKHA